jgi:hypothetical protein
MKTGESANASASVVPANYDKSIPPSVSTCN